jgi:CDP-diglyceride synthetase
MNLLTAIAAWSVLAFGFVLFLLQLGAHEIGYRFGRRRAAGGAAPAESVGVVVGGMLALLAFVLALTLSFANNSFSERRAGTLAEANAIGTAWLRAQAIGGPRGSEIARLLEQYTQLRIAFVRADNDPAELDDLNRRTNALQTEIWGHASAIARERTDPVVVSLMAALNDTFDMTTATRFAYALRLPPQLSWLLFAMALMSMAALGYQVGLRGNPSHALAALLTLMWTAVIVDILDLATPRIGALRTSAAVYEWTVQGFQGGVPIPPPPNSK